jgi:hypothetical protein
MSSLLAALVMALAHIVYGGQQREPVRATVPVRRRG